MHTSIYALLNADAKNWWYHKQLRRNNNPTEARKRERRSIASHLETLRNAYFWTVGEGGWTVHGREELKYGGKSSGILSGYGDIESPIIQAALRLGVPGYDTSMIPVNHQFVRVVISCPLLSDTKDEPNTDGEYSGLSYAPPRIVLSHMAQAGAVVYNWPCHGDPVIFHLTGAAS